MIRLVLDTACNRVIYFSLDPAQRLVLNQHVYLRDWFDQLPNGMHINNCWDWKLVGNRLILDDQTPQQYKKSLLETNRERMLLFLEEKINQLRKPYQSNLIAGDFLRQLKYEQSKAKQGVLIEKMAEFQQCSVDEMSNEILFQHCQFIDFMTETELFRERVKEQIQMALDNQTLYDLRDLIAEYNPDKESIMKNSQVTVK